MKTLIAFILGLIAAPLILVLAAIAGWLPSNSTAAPPKWEASLATRALDASLEKRSNGLSNPIRANDTVSLATGKKIYADNCSGCHGDAQGPSDWGAKGLYPRAPQFFQTGSNVTASEAFAAIRDGIRYSGMGAWDGQLDDKQMWEAANFVASIQAKNRGKKDSD